MEIRPLETITRLGLYDCDLSPDGSAVAAVYREDEGPRLGVWSTTGCNPILTLDLVGPYERPRFSPGGSSLAAAQVGGLVTVWSLARGKEVFHRARDGGAAIAAHAFGPGGDTLVIAQGERVGLWRIDNGEWLGAVPFSGAVQTLAAANDGRLLGVGLHAGGAAVVDLEGPDIIATLPGMDQAVTALSFHPEQPWLMAATAPSFVQVGQSVERREHGWAHVWNYRTGEEVLRVACDYHAVLVGGGDYLATLTDNSRSLWIWHVQTGDLAAHIENAAPEMMVDERGHELRPVTLSATASGDLLAVAGLTRAVAVTGVLRLFAIHPEAVPTR